MTLPGKCSEGFGKEELANNLSSKTLIIILIIIIRKYGFLRGVAEKICEFECKGTDPDQTFCWFVFMCYDCFVTAQYVLATCLSCC